MAKYCMFCGEEIPNNAQFCPSCGQKQAAATKTESAPSKSTKHVIEDEDDEMDLLLKYGMMVSTPKIKQEPQKIITLDYKPDIEEDIVEEPIKEEPVLQKSTESYLEESLLKESQNNYGNIPIIKEEIIEEEPIIENIPMIKEDDFIIEEEPIVENIPMIKEIYHEPTIEEKPIINEPLIKEDVVLKKPVEEEKTEVDNSTTDEDSLSLDDWDDWDNDDDFGFAEESPTESIINTIESEPELDTDLPKEQPLANRPVAKRRDVSIRRRSVSIEDEEESFSTSLGDSNKNSMLEAADMLADEKADYEKRKNVTIEEDIDAKLDDRSDLEGRKQQTQKIEKRRKSQRTYDESKHYKIEQDKSDINEDEDPEYDGYYENVLPIDHDQERKKTFDVKLLLIIFLLIGICVGLIYFMLGSF